MITPGSLDNSGCYRSFGRWNPRLENETVAGNCYIPWFISEYSTLSGNVFAYSSTTGKNYARMRDAQKRKTSKGVFCAASWIRPVVGDKLSSLSFHERFFYSCATFWHRSFSFFCLSFFFSSARGLRKPILWTFNYPCVKSLLMLFLWTWEDSGGFTSLVQETTR